VFTVLQGVARSASEDESTRARTSAL